MNVKSQLKECIIKYKNIIDIYNNINTLNDRISRLEILNDFNNSNKNKLLELLTNEINNSFDNIILNVTCEKIKINHINNIKQLYYEKVKNIKLINKYKKEIENLQNTNNYNNEIIKFNNTISDIILSCPIINENKLLFCPICLDTKITCMVQLNIKCDQNQKNKNKCLSLSKCCGTTICYSCANDMYYTQRKNNYNNYICIYCREPNYVSPRHTPFIIKKQSNNIIDMIIKTEYLSIGSELNLKLPSLISCICNKKYNYINELINHLLNDIPHINNTINSDSDNDSDSDSDNESNYTNN